MNQHDRAGMAKLGSSINDKKSLVFLARSARESNDETNQKESHGRVQGQGSVSSALLKFVLHIAYMNPENKNANLRRLSSIESFIH
jgi:hypothetical protein